MKLTPIVWSPLHGREFGHLNLSAGSEFGRLEANRIQPFEYKHHYL